MVAATGRGGVIDGPRSASIEGVAAANWSRSTLRAVFGSGARVRDAEPHGPEACAAHDRDRDAPRPRRRARRLGPVARRQPDAGPGLVGHDGRHGIRLTGRLRLPVGEPERVRGAGLRSPARSTGSSWASTRGRRGSRRPARARSPGPSTSRRMPAPRGGERQSPGAVTRIRPSGRTEAFVVGGEQGDCDMRLWSTTDGGQEWGDAASASAAWARTPDDARRVIRPGGEPVTPVREGPRARPRLARP